MFGLISITAITAKTVPNRVPHTALSQYFLISRNSQYHIILLLNKRAYHLLIMS